jgi:hypothetical protein
LTAQHAAMEKAIMWLRIGLHERTVARVKFYSIEKNGESTGRGLRDLRWVSGDDRANRPMLALMSRQSPPSPSSTDGKFDGATCALCADLR